MYGRREKNSRWHNGHKNVGAAGVRHGFSAQFHRLIFRCNRKNVQIHEVFPAHRSDDAALLQWDNKRDLNGFSGKPAPPDIIFVSERKGEVLFLPDRSKKPDAAGPPHREKSLRYCAEHGVHAADLSAHSVPHTATNIPHRSKKRWGILYGHNFHKHSTESRHRCRHIERRLLAISSDHPAVSNRESCSNSAGGNNPRSKISN